MNRNLALATTLAISLAFAFGASQDPARGAVIDPGMTRAGTAMVGGWSVSENGVLFRTDDSSATVSAAYVAERSAALAAVQADLDRQINGESDVASVSIAAPADKAALRSAALAAIAADLDCQINGCDR